MDHYEMILSASFTGEVPEYIKVLPSGSVSSEKGDFIVDAESFRLMKEHMQHRNIDIVIDYEHQTLYDVQAPAGGWIKELILKSDGVYARVEWTARAKRYLKEREYRYLSPVVMVREQDKRATQLHSAALTNTPAINGMVPIINSVKPSLKAGTGLDGIQEEICRMMNISEADFMAYSTGGGCGWIN